MIVAFCACLILGAEPQDWAAIIRDAQVTNRDRLREGHASMELTYTPPKSIGDKDVKMSARVAWKDEAIAATIEYFCDYDQILGRISDPSGATPVRCRLLANKLDAYLFTESPHILNIQPIAQKAFSVLLDFHPLHLWMSCCPPSHDSDLGWAKWVDHKVTDRSGAKSVITFERQGEGEIKQIRRDVEGDVVETIYSLSLGGNVVEVRHDPPARRGGNPLRGSYRWRRLNSTFVLDSCEFRGAPLDRPSEWEVYKLRVTHVDLNPVAAAELDLAAFLKSLPPRTQVYDGTKRTTYTTKAAKPAEASYGQFSDAILSRGFARPR